MAEAAEARGVLIRRKISHRDAQTYEIRMSVSCYEAEKRVKYSYAHIFMGMTANKNETSKRSMKPFPPQSSGPDSWPPCFIVFRVTNQERFQIFAHSFEILKQEKLKYLTAVFERDEHEERQENDRY
ncbi:MAG TPA: hypothetical protein VGN34_22475, partial [Ktedonobacteraceae bacterium]